jgi:uncharacterized membrane protein
MRQVIKEKKIYVTILIISLICIALSITIQLEKRQYSQNQAGICSAITGSNGCEAVQTSEYASAFGIDNPIYGMAGFSILAILSSIYLWKRIASLKHIIMTGNIIAGLAAIWFLYLQFSVLHKYCIFCLMVDTLSLILLVISMYILFENGIKK